MTNIKNLGSEEAPKWYFVTTILVNGEELEIILPSPIILSNLKTLRRTKYLKL